MAQDVALWGVAYTDVPEVRVPRSGGGMAAFHDVSDTTATASDVASGKLFHAADGSLTTGTASGGGGGTVKVGALRPDAELAHAWTFDKMMVADLGLAIPEWSTSANTVKPVEVLGTYGIDADSYNWYVIARTLTIPVYSTDAVAKGREEYQFSSYAYEYIDMPAANIRTLVNPSKTMTKATRTLMGVGSLFRLVYWSSTTAIGLYSSMYGIVQNLSTNPTVSGTTLTVSSPALVMRGNATYLSQTYWEAMTDCRIQYVIELYRSPKSAEVDGWTHTSQLLHTLSCAQSADHKLT